MHERLRTYLLHKWSDLVCRFPRTILILAALSAAACALLAATRLGYQPNRNDLISPDLPWNRYFIDWQESFASSADLVIAVDAAPPHGSGLDPQTHRAQAEAMVQALAERLTDHPLIANVMWGFDSRDFSPRTLRIAAEDEFQDRLAQIAQSRLLLASPTAADLIRQAVAEAQAQLLATNPAPAPGTPRTPGTPGSPGSSGATGSLPASVPEASEGPTGSKLPVPPTSPAPGSPTPDGPTPGNSAAALSAEQAQGLEQMTRLVRAIRTALETPADQPLDLRALVESADAGNPWRFLESDSGRYLFLMISPRAEEGQLNALAGAIEAVRGILAEVGQEYPAIQAGLTGIEAIEGEETRIAIADSTKASLIAVVLIAMLLVAAFANWRAPLLALLALLVGIAWTFGFLTLAIGHLQVLSVIFTVILLGLGIDYGVLLSTSYELVRHNYPDGPEGFRQAMRRSFAKAGPGIITGAVTTAAAFLTTLPTKFTGVAEMGLIAAVGVLLCLLAMFTVFPALLSRFKRDHGHVVEMERRRFHVFEERWVMPFVRRPGLTLGAAAVVAVGSMALAGAKLHFDYDLLKLQPPKAEAVRWAQRVGEDAGGSIWYAVSLAPDLESARRRAEQFRALPTVSDVGGAGLLFPAHEADKIAQLQALRQQLEPALGQALRETDQPTQAADQLAQLRALRVILNLAGRQSLPQPLAQALAHLSAEIEGTLAQADRLDPAARQRRTQRLEQLYRQYRRQTAEQIDQALDAAPLRLEDLPPALYRTYRDPQGRVALHVNPKLPAGIDSPYDPRFLPRFVRQLEQVDPQITGVPLQIFRSGRLIRDAYVTAGALALALVFILVLIDFRSVADALLSLVPILLGFAATFAAMALLGETINMANIIVLPLMFGIGVDAGVHVLHRYRQDPEHRPPGLTGGTGKGITITSATTAIGFGAILLAEHRGMRSLGLVMTLGILLTMLACWTVMPAILELRQRRRERREMVAASLLAEDAAKA